MKKVSFVFLIMWLCFICSCTIIGDTLVNPTGQKFRVVVYSQTGQVLKSGGILPPHWAGSERRTSWIDPGNPYQRIEAFDESGHKIGQFNRDQIPRKGGHYGNFLTILITDQGVFPVPNKYLRDAEDHINEIIAYDAEHLTEPAH